MKKHFTKILLMLAIVPTVFASCARNTSYTALQSAKLETAQILTQHNSFSEDAEKIVFVKAEEDLAPSGIPSTLGAEKEHKRFSINKKATKTAIIKQVKNTVLALENRVESVGNNAAMSTTADPNDGFKMVGIIFIIFGLIALIPPLLFSVGSYMFIVAGILLAFGALFLLTGAARSAE